MIKMSINITPQGFMTMAQIRKWQAELPKQINKQLAVQAHRLRGMIVLGIRNQAPGGIAFKPLSPITKKLKRSSKALINHGDLMRSVGVDNIGGNSFFVGVNRSANGGAKDGGKPAELYNLAEIHETGTEPFVIEITDKMRRFWWAMYFKKIFKAPLRPSTKVIQHGGIPARPFMAPSFNKWHMDAEKLFMDGVSRAMGVTKE
jgi:hypothetical protein